MVKGVVCFYKTGWGMRTGTLGAEDRSKAATFQYFRQAHQTL